MSDIIRHGFLSARNTLVICLGMERFLVYIPQPGCKRSKGKNKNLHFGKSEWTVKGG